MGAEIRLPIRKCFCLLYHSEQQNQATKPPFATPRQIPITQVKLIASASIIESHAQWSISEYAIEDDEFALCYAAYEFCFVKRASLVHRQHLGVWSVMKPLIQRNF